MKDLTNSRRRVAGFTLVETMLAIGLLSLVAVMSSRTLLDTTKSIHSLVYEKKTSALVEMIFQQYSAYTSQNYQLLASYNVTNQQPKDFFNRLDNFGYDGILITTLATYSTNRSSCAVSVSLTWTIGGQPKTSTYLKTYVGSSQLGSGANLQVYVKAPCSQGVSPQTIIQYCPGIQGFLATGTGSSGGSTVFGTTDPSGQTLLKAVLSGGNVPIQVSAPTVVDFNATGNPSYYAQDSLGNYVATLTKNVPLDPTVTNTLVITDFRSAGQLTGQLYNDDTNPNAPVEGLSVTLDTGAIVASGGTYQNCGTTIVCTVITGPNGQFTFNNMIPLPFGLASAGRSGSAPNVQQGPGFSWGYGNTQPLNILASDWNMPSGGRNVMTQGPILSEPIHVQRLGWAVLNITNKITNLPFPNVVVNALVTPMAFQAMAWNSPPATSDNSGVVTLYNLFGTNNAESVTVSGGIIPVAGVTYGASGSTHTYTVTNGMGQANPITVPIMPGYQLTGQVIDDNPTNGLAGMYIEQNYAFPGSAKWNLDSSGHFSMAGFIPTADASSSIPQTLLLENYKNPQSYTIQGNTFDQLTGAPAPHTTLDIHNSNGLLLFQSDANGYINISSTMPYYVRPTVTVTCDDTSMQCVACPTGMSCPVSSGGSPFHIDTRTNSIEFDPYSGAHGYVYTQFQTTAYQGIPAVALSVPCTLQDYKVKGLTTNLAAQPIAGITVADGDGVTVDTSDDGTQGTTLGAYNGYATVDGHTASKTGTVTLTVPTQKGFLATNVGPTTLPTPIDPTVPIVQNIELAPTGSGSGGGI